MAATPDDPFTGPMGDLFAPTAGKAVDPVCGMSVDPATAEASATHEGRTVWFCCEGCKETFLADPARFASGPVAPAPAKPDAAVDPVCGMKVERSGAKHSAIRGGKRYLFCCAACRAKFVADPEKYLNPQPAPAAPPGTVYICPMDPEVRQIGPGACPICGMALEPEMASADAGPNPELVDMKQRFVAALALTTPVFALAMGAHMFDLHRWIAPSIENLIEFALATPVVFWAGWPFLQRGAASLVSRRFNMFTLISLGVSVAWVYSLVATFAPWLFPEALERLDRVDTIVFDKTGTLTEGRPRVTRVFAAPGVDADEALRLAASLERASEHPLANAIVAAAKEKQLPLAEAHDFAMTAGQGVSGQVKGRSVVVGSSAAGFDTEAAAMRSQGATMVFITIDGQPAAALAIVDPIKQTTRPALVALKAEGLRLVMITGDHHATAEAVARELGLDAWEAEVAPERKADAIVKLRAEGRVVAMAGDGVNDAPALAAADVGIAMGTGADVAKETAGVTLLGGDLMALVRARRLARATLRNIRQNLIFAFLYNAAGVPIAAGVLYPAFGITLSPVIAAAAMSLSSVSVIANALRLKRSRLG